MRRERILKSSVDFLKILEKNNDRTWFKMNKHTYDAARANVANVAEEILQGLANNDVLSTESGAKSLYRVYRDVRFSKDKTPYTTWYSAYFRRAGADRRGGYYLRIEPGGKSVIGGGFWGPNKEDLKLIREQIAVDDGPLREALKDSALVDSFGALQGQQLKTAPKGWAKDHPAIDLLRYKQFILMKELSDKEVLSAGYSQLVLEGFQNMRPFLDAMSLYLTTDLNGESIL